MATRHTTLGKTIIKLRVRLRNKIRLRFKEENGVTTGHGEPKGRRSGRRGLD